VVSRLECRPPRGVLSSDLVATDPDLIAAVLEDAAHYPDGRASGVAAPRSEADLASVLRRSRTVLPIGAQSSLTGGATPRGDVVIRTDRLASILNVGRDRVRVQAGVSLADLDAALRSRGAAYPPVPTFAGRRRSSTERHETG
jgi:D-lactate dehydrogenase (cytochrome)